jgi:hypothetical protein
MDTLTPSRRANPLASWDATRQKRYQHSGAVPTIRLLLDASGSMAEHASTLITSVNLLLLHLRTMTSPLAPLEIWGFQWNSFSIAQSTVGTCPPLTAQTYIPSGGTRLRRALSQLLHAGDLPGQQVVVVFTDGMDLPWHDQVLDDAWPLHRPPLPDPAILLPKRIDDGWLCVYLGAFVEALQEGKAMGFAEGNTLVFSAYALAEAWRQLEDGLQRFFAAPPETRKLLTTGGIFATPKE